MKKISDNQLRNIIREAVEEYTTGAGYSIRQADGNMSNYKFHAAPNSFGDQFNRKDVGGVARQFGRTGGNMNAMRGNKFIKDKDGNRIANPNYQRTGADDFNVQNGVNYGNGWTSKAIKHAKGGKDFYTEIKDLVDDIDNKLARKFFGTDPMVAQVVNAYMNSMMGLANLYLRQVRGYNVRANKKAANSQQISIPSNGGTGYQGDTSQPVQQVSEAMVTTAYGVKADEGWITSLVKHIQSLIDDGVISEYAGAGTDDIDSGTAMAKDDTLAKRKNEAGLMTKDFLELLRLAKMSTVTPIEQMDKILPPVPAQNGQNGAQDGTQGGNMPVPVGGQGGTNMPVPFGNGGQGGNMPVPVGDGGQGGYGGTYGTIIPPYDQTVDDQGEQPLEPTPEQEKTAFRDKGKVRRILGRLATLMIPLLVTVFGVKQCTNMAQADTSSNPNQGGAGIVAPAPISQEQSTKCTCNVGSPQINEAQQLAQFAQSLQAGTQVTILVWGNNAAGTNWNETRQQQLDQQRMQNAINIIQQANPEVKVVKQNFGDWTKNTGTPNITVSTVSSSTYAMERRKSNKPVISESELREMICRCIKKSLKKR